MADAAQISRLNIFLMRTVRLFFYQELNYSIWRETEDWQKIPDDLLEKCQRCFFQFVYTVSREKIHRSKIVNMDQTVVVFIPVGDDPNYKLKDSKQVLIYGKDKKDVFICVT